MSHRPKPTLMDYMVVGISPALIMAMVGSLLFYLLLVFYHGQYGGRLNFIFAMFVMAIVLIGRISMERGIEYASLFALPLGLVTMMAMARFVRISGPLAEFSLLINFGLIALVWWSAHKLTWDCTLIDDSQDSSGEGLLQGMGFDGDTVESQAAEQVVEPENQPPTDDKEFRNNQKNASGVPTWWLKFVNRRHRPHTPGVWVVYYALAALPLFAIGQWLIPDSHGHYKLTAFRLLVVYVGSALGLLLTTSFLGLRRYLRQRKMEMPVDMAGLWLGIGSILIVAILAFCVFLPRPGAALKISQMPVSFGSPEHDRTHRNAVGNDGPEKQDEADRTRETATKSGENAPTDREGKQAGANSDKGSSKSGTAKGKRSQQGKSGSTQAKQANQSKQSQGSGESGKSNSNSAGQKRDAGAQRSKSDGQQKNGGSSGEPSKSPSKNASGKEGKANGKQSRSNQKDSSTKDSGKNGQPNQEGQDGQRDDRKDGSQKSTPDDRQRQGKSKRSSSQGGKKEQGEQKNRDDKLEQAPEKREASSSQNSSSGPSTLSRIVNRITSGFGALIKLLFWAILICIVAFFAWKYRDRVIEAIRQLIADLKNLLASLFGRKREPEEADEAQPINAKRESFRPFNSYADPFTGGAAERYSTEQLIRYTFEAMEAWARDRACPRDDEQTPLEFARQLAVEHPNLGVEAQQLADLYSRVAYGKERVAKERHGVLQQLWRHMRSTAAMPAPPAA